MDVIFEETVRYPTGASECSAEMIRPGGAKRCKGRYISKEIEEGF